MVPTPFLSFGQVEMHQCVIFSILGVISLQRGMAGHGKLHNPVTALFSVIHVEMYQCVSLTVLGVTAWHGMEGSLPRGRQGREGFVTGLKFQIFLP